jgi:hypothetical protein
MHIKDAIGWLGLIVLEFGLFVLLDGKHMQPAIILIIFGFAALAASVYLYHRHDVRIPGWIAFCVATQLAAFYDFYDRRHATPEGVMLYLTLALILAVGYALYRIAIAVYLYKLRIANRRWEAYLKIVNKSLPEASVNDMYASLVGVLLNGLGNIQCPPELLHPLSDSIFTIPIKEWEGYPVDVYLFRRAFNFLRNRLTILEEILPENNNERTSDEIKRILERTAGALIDKANALRKECYDNQPTT